MSNKVIDADMFAVNLNGIFAEIEMRLTTNLDQPVKKACVEARKVAKETGQYKNRTGKYRAGFTYHVDRKGKYEALGYVGNKVKPGLVHLLEHGHATMNGGRTREFPHMIHGCRAGERVLIEEASKLADKALR